MSDLDDQDVLLTREQSVLIVWLNRPERLNALRDPQTFWSLSRAWMAAAEPDVRAVVVTGMGRGFCAGADLRAEPADAETPVGLRHSFNSHVLTLAALRKPVIAAVNGVAAGAGLSLACAADIRLCGPAATFVPAFARVGVVPDAGATYFIPRIVGHARAIEWLLTAQTIDAETALAWGLVSDVVAPEDLVAAAIERAQLLAAMPPTALGLTKALLEASAGATLAGQLEAETVAQLQAVAAPERAAARAAVVATLGAQHA